MATPHVEKLSSLCRICGQKLGKDPVCAERYKLRIVDAYFINIEADKPDIHPPKICMRCYTTMRNIESRGTTTTLDIKDWQKIECHNCICTCYNYVKIPGRKLKQKKQGRPPAKLTFWTRTKLNTIKESTPKLSVEASLIQKQNFNVDIIEN